MPMPCSGRTIRARGGGYLARFEQVHFGPRNIALDQRYAPEDRVSPVQQVTVRVGG